MIAFDQTQTHANQKRLKDELHFVYAALSRQQALSYFLQHPHDTEHLNSPAQLSLSHIPDTYEQASFSELEQHSQRVLLWQQWQDYRSRLGVLESQLKNRLAEQDISTAIIEKLQATLPIVRQRTAALQVLAEKKMVPEIDYLSMEQQRIEQLQELKAEKARMRQHDAAIEEMRHNLTRLKAELNSQVLTAIEEYQRQIAVLSQELNKAQDFHSRQILYAPVDGRVQQLAANTVGGVVTEAEPVMLIVPRQASLEVEAVLENKDIGFVNQGQLAEIKVHTFPFTKYGIIKAEVIDITADAIESEQQGLVYKLRLKLHSSQLYVGEKWVDILPGMAVSAEMITGKRRLIEFFLAPLLRYRQESVRER